MGGKEKTRRYAAGRGKLFGSRLGDEDSNLDVQIQSLLSCH